MPVTRDPPFSNADIPAFVHDASSDAVLADEFAIQVHFGRAAVAAAPKPDSVCASSVQHHRWHRRAAVLQAASDLASSGGRSLRHWAARLPPSEERREDGSYRRFERAGSPHPVPEARPTQTRSKPGGCSMGTGAAAAAAPRMKQGEGERSTGRSALIGIPAVPRRHWHARSARRHAAGKGLFEVDLPSGRRPVGGLDMARGLDQRSRATTRGCRGPTTSRTAVHPGGDAADRPSFEYCAGRSARAPPGDGASLASLGQRVTHQTPTVEGAPAADTPDQAWLADGCCGGAKCFKIRPRTDPLLRQGHRRRPLTPVTRYFIAVLAWVRPGASWREDRK